MVCLTCDYYSCLVEKYFEMNKKQCKEALDLYKKFLVRMDKVSEFLKTAEVSKATLFCKMIFPYNVYDAYTDFCVFLLE